jgi:hypothetical protein
MHRRLQSGNMGEAIGFDTITRNGSIVTATDTYAADISGGQTDFHDRQIASHRERS